MKYYYQIEGDRRDNIGDVLQGMVAKEFLPKDSLVANREALNDLAGPQKGLLIANGWYMHSFEKFPPPDNITPIYISVHIRYPKMLAIPTVREHFKKHAPIGCRDTRTLKLFLSWGIPAYYSSCLTTTCKQRAPINNSGDGEVLLVDNMHHPVPDAVKEKLEGFLGKPLTRISHDPPNTSGTLEQYNEVAEKHMNSLLERYCKAALVITTKIHCALPCIGMGANVMLIHPNPNNPRLNTLWEFMDIFSFNDILAASTLQRPVVKEEKLKRRQAFLTTIVQKSVQNKRNIVREPDSLPLRLLKIKCQIMAMAYNTKKQIMDKVRVGKERVAGAV